MEQTTFKLIAPVRYNGKEVGSTGSIEVVAECFEDAVELAKAMFLNGKTFMKHPGADVPDDAVIEAGPWYAARRD